MRGLPFRVKYDEIMDYFNEFNPIEKSAILQLAPDGRKNGFGAILF